MKIPETGDIRRRFLLFVQVSLILLPITAFFDAALFYRGRINLSVTVAAAVFVLLNGALISFAGAAIHSFVRSRSAGKIDAVEYGNFQRRTGILSLLPLFAVILLFTVLALSQFGNLPVYDAGLYYSPLMSGTDTFQYSVSSFMTSFALWNHPTQGYALLAGTGEMLFPGKSIGVYIAALVLTDAALLCLYRIMGRLFPHAGTGVKAAGTAVFAFCPYILGLFSYQTPDYFLTMLFVILVWCFAEELDYLGGYLTILVCFCKETGILLAASFLLTAMYFRIRGSSGKGFLSKTLSYLFPKRLLLYSASPVLFILYYLFLGNLNFGSSSTHHSPLIWDSSSYHCFGFSIRNITARLSQFFLYNLFWVVFSLVILSAAIILIRRIKHGRHTGGAGEKADPNVRSFLADMHIAAGIAAATLAYLVFLCLFITYLCPRYSTLYAFPLSLLSILAMTILFRKGKLPAILLSFLAGLFLVQSYINIDPVIAANCPRLDAGNLYLYSPTPEWYGSKFNLTHSGEMYVYNQSYSYFNDLVDKAFRKIQLTKDDTILCVGLDWYELYLVGNIWETDHMIFWDPENNCRTYDSTIENAFVPKFISPYGKDVLGDAEIDLPDDFYFILTARRSDDYVKAIEARGYKTVDSFTERNYVGYINVYHMKKTQ